MSRALSYIEAQFDQALRIWISGGWGMWAIAAVSLVMFGMGVNVWLKLQATGFRSVPERKWRQWIEEPKARRGPVGRMLDLVTNARTIQETAHAFDQIRLTEAKPFERDLLVMKICVSAAPLVGLLGTVTGMLATFNALSTGTGGQKTMGMIAEGISVALVTTMTGLVVALPGLFFQYQLARNVERFKAFLAHVETVCTQTLYRRSLRRRSAA